jgi:hypothetical protein
MAIESHAGQTTAGVAPAARLLVHVASIVAFCLFYAVLRYVVFKGVGLGHVAFLANKALSLSGLVLLALAVHASPGLQPASSYPSAAAPHVRARVLGQAGLLLVACHVFCSFLLLTPSYFSAFFAPDGRLTARAEVAMLMGVVGFVALVWMARKPPALRLLAVVVLAAAGLHAFFLGYPGWLEPWTWPGYMPPITLLSFCVSFCAVVALPVRR